MPSGPLLIVDDEPINLSILASMLEKDYRLLFARNGAEALLLAIEHNPALVLLDIQLPDMDGYAVCRALKADSRTEDIPVIFVTVLSGLGDEEIGFAAGCVDYLIKPLSPGIVRARVRAHLSLVTTRELEKSRRAAIFMLGKAWQFNDVGSGAHIWRMAAYARQLAAEVGWSAEQCELLELAAPMHDAGKIGIPDAIMHKVERLDVEEWTLMQTHSRIGFEILSASDAPLFQLAAEIALYHHEKWDGSGYLAGLAGEAIPHSARIVAVADVFDALTMKRPDKPAWSPEQAATTLRRQAGKHFDPALIAAFDACLPQILKLKADWDRCEEAHDARCGDVHLPADVTSDWGLA